MMMRFIFPLFSVVFLTACATSIPSVEVTRFHLQQAIQPGKIKILGDSSLEATTYRAAVAQELAIHRFEDIGLTKIMPQYNAHVSITRTIRDERKSSPISIGVGGGTGGRVGVGVGTSIGLGGGVRQIVVMSLSVIITRAGDGSRVWEGRAVTEAKATSPAAQSGLAAKKLAGALFRDFPGRSGETIIVK